MKKKHVHSVHKRNKNKIKKVRLWQTSTAVLGVLLILSFFIGGFGKSAASKMSAQAVADKTVNFINENLMQGRGTAKLNGVEESNGMYLLKLNIGGQEMESYVSSDGKLLFPQVIDLTKKPQSQQPPETQDTQTNIQKSDKPKVELFVMSHCPYGTQMEKGILPVVKELGNKIDFELKFVNYAMHPTQGEVEEQLNQYCIQRDYNDKYLAYLGKFLEAGDGKEALSAVGLSEADISGCVQETDKEFDVIKNLEDKSSWSGGRFPQFMIYDADNKKYGVRGSPTLIINGQQAQSGRDAQSLLNTICGAFDGKPEECNTD
ncbi:hypothetical protein GOV08_04605, partial [Candidatus Woesearchaeota archaeon]|nr:hypothetical protein [Candidatus Woesearchaeota archaeon]